MNAFDNAAMQALSDAGAQCGDCGDQPGDRICPDCERCYGWYVAALRKAGWAPRAEVLNEAADAVVVENDRRLWATKPGSHWAADLLRRMADAPPVPDNTTGDEGSVRCTCARSWGLHSQDCPKYTPGHELASPAAELARLREERDELYAKADFWRESYRLAKGYTDDELNARVAIDEATRPHQSPCRWPSSPTCTCTEGGDR